METLVEKLLRRNELSHAQLMEGLLALDEFLCAEGIPAREKVFNHLGLAEADREVYREIMRRLHDEPESCWSLNFYFPQPITVVGLPKSDSQSIALDQGVGRMAKIARTILPRGPESSYLGTKQIFNLGEKKVENLLGFFGMPEAPMALLQDAMGRYGVLGHDAWKQVLWFGDKSAFTVLHFEKYDVVRADYCFDLGGGYWGSRSDLTGEQVMVLFMGGSGSRRKVMELSYNTDHVE
jgi:hypothetical protein